LTDAEVDRPWRRRSVKRYGFIRHLMLQPMLGSW